MFPGEFVEYLSINKTRCHTLKSEESYKLGIAKTPKKYGRGFIGANGLIFPQIHVSNFLWT